MITHNQMSVMPIIYSTPPIVNAVRSQLICIQYQLFTMMNDIDRQGFLIKKTGKSKE